MMTMIIQIITIALLFRCSSGFTKPSSFRSVGKRLQTIALISQGCSGFTQPSSLTRSSSILQTKQTTTLNSQSVNDNTGGFHYEQEPRGTSYMSQISERDLYERRKMRRDTLSQRVASSNMRNTPNSRGGSYQQQMKQQVMNMRQPPIQEMQRPARSRMDTENVLYNNNMVQQQQQPSINNEEFNTFKNNVSQSLLSMTNLLKEMQSNQNIQNTDVQVLTRRVADMTNRLGKATAMQQNDNDNGGGRSSEEIDNMINQINERGAQETSFGTSLDGQFNQKIKEFVVDKSDDNNKLDDSNFIDQTPSSGRDEQYYPVSKVAQLENKINKIDSFLQSMENKFDTLINDRLDGIEDVPLSVEREPFMVEDRQPPIPPPMYEQEVPPPLQPMPPPPPIQDGFDEGFDMDDGRAFYQERNFNARSFNQANNNIPPPPPPQFREQISSSQQQMANNNNSVNISSSGHHYNDRNTSFISSFSKEDNRRRRQFNPFDDSRRRREMNNMGEQFSPPSRMMGMNDGPMMMMGEDEFIMYEDPMMDGPMMMDDMY